MKLSISERYVVLALAADKLYKDRAVVFTFFGHPHFKKISAEWTKRGHEGIIDELNLLEEDATKNMEDDPPFFRRTYLVSQIRSLRALLETGEMKLNGDLLTKAVASVLGFTPPPPYDVCQIRSELQSVLGKYGYAHYGEFKAEADKLAPARKVSDGIVKEWIGYLMRCFKDDIGSQLFCGEELSEKLSASVVKLARYKDGYPSCYYAYRGKGRGHIYLSGNHRSDDLTALRTLIHELCPGHHVYYLYRELLFSLGHLGAEATIDLVYSSETPISEGIAETALFYLSSLDPVMKKNIEIATAREHFCKKLLYNVWHDLYVECKTTDAEAKSYLADVGGFDHAKTGSWIEFLDNWRIYYPSYPVGTERMKQYIKADPNNIFYLYLPRSLPVLDKFERRKI
jgi:hypothetical protein